MYPHGRSLVKKMEGRPFVLVGINSDSDRDKVLKLMKDGEVTWRSWWDGGSYSGPLATAFNVLGWPTIFVLDQEGTIRFKSTGVVPNMDNFTTLIEKLVSDIEKEQSGVAKITKSD